jgi:hypothetical protein
MVTGQENDIIELKERISMLEHERAGVNPRSLQEDKRPAIFGGDLEEEIDQIKIDLAQNTALIAQASVDFSLIYEELDEVIYPSLNEIVGYLTFLDFILFGFVFPYLENVYLFALSHQYLLLDEFDGLCYLDGNTTGSESFDACVASYEEFCFDTGFCVGNLTNTSTTSSFGKANLLGEMDGGGGPEFNFSIPERMPPPSMPGKVKESLAKYAEKVKESMAKYADKVHRRK